VFLLGCARAGAGGIDITNHDDSVGPLFLVLRSWCLGFGFSLVKATAGILIADLQPLIMPFNGMHKRRDLHEVRPCTNDREYFHGRALGKAEIGKAESRNGSGIRETVGGWRWAVGCWRLAVGCWQLAVGTP